MYQAARIKWASKLPLAIVVATGRRTGLPYLLYRCLEFRLFDVQIPKPYGIPLYGIADQS